MYIYKKDFDSGMVDDIIDNGFNIVDTNIPLCEEDTENLETIMMTLNIIKKRRKKTIMVDLM